MWFATPAKVHRKLDQLIADFRRIDERLKEHEAQHEFAKGMFGPSPELMEMRGIHDAIVGPMLESSLGLSFGKLTAKDIAPNLKATEKLARQLTVLLDQMDAGAAAGREAFREKFGNQ